MADGRQGAGRLVAAVAALAMTGVATCAGAAPAAAERLSVRDARGDMIRVDEGGSNPQPAPHATVGDVLRTSFRHTEHRVVVRTRLAALDRTGKRFTVWVDVQDGARRTWSVGVEATRADRDGHVVLLTPQGTHGRCPTRHRIDYADDAVRVSVPRRCLGTPQVTRFRLLTEHVRRSWHHAWLDNGLAVRQGDRHWTRWLASGREARELP